VTWARCWSPVATAGAPSRSSLSMSSVIQQKNEAWYGSSMKPSLIRINAHVRKGGSVRCRGGATS
jgi:hypothetical protein